MSVKIERQIVVEVECDCSKACEVSYGTRRQCFKALAMAGWQIKLHRKGESTVRCFDCATEASTEKAAHKNSRAVIKQARDDALAKYKEEMAALKSGEEKEA